MKPTDYKRLIVWQKSVDLTVEIYSLVKLLPKEEIYALSDQMRRSVISIPSNIAEGRGRESDKEFLYFLFVAKGSLHELETQIEICKKLKFCDENQTKNAINLIIEISKMINSLIYSIKNSH